MARNTAMRAEVWMTNFGLGQGHEQAGSRPSLIVSDNGFNQSGADLVVVVPITSKAKGIRTHVEIQPPEGGLTMISFAKCEDIRSISTTRLSKRMGMLTATTMADIELVLRMLLVL